MEHYLHNWLLFQDTLLSPHTALHQASPPLQLVGCGSKNGSCFWLRGAHTPPIQLCTAVVTEHDMPQCCFFPTTLLTLISFPSQERKLGCQWHFTNAAACLQSLGFQQWGQPRAHGGCWFGWRAPWNRAGVLHMVCHSSVCSSLPMQIVCASTWRLWNHISLG